jgi:hypothetical protein
MRRSTAVIQIADLCCEISVSRSQNLGEEGQKVVTVTPPNQPVSWHPAGLVVEAVKRPVTLKGVTCNS